MTKHKEPGARPPKRILPAVLLSIIGLLMAIAVQLARPLLLGNDSSHSTIAHPWNRFITSSTTTATQQFSRQTQKTPTPAQFASFSLSHFTGGFGIESNAEIANAVDDGIQSTLIYGFAPKGIDPVSQALAANNIKVIDEMPWEYLYYF